jgi:uncharacterized protein (DUF1778 family)
MGSAAVEAPLDRVAARVPREVKQQWVQAAGLRGQTLTDFIIVAANNAMQEAFAEHETITLTRQSQEAFAALLENPPALSSAMRDALRERLS